ncbi:MAG: sigma-70 family RNA polymerase sigma factor [Gemmataceae bacterium]|nr:sigma-70 family RNA polymerase sigma factor [Gemmataceae bacterium]
MPPGPIAAVLDHLHRLVARAADARSSDGHLLRRFAEHHDESAFAELMQRHGRMVWHVCRTLLANSHDADDAFQATFLVLARKADSIRRRDSVSSWLYGVAYRCALKTRRRAAMAAPTREAEPMARDDPLHEATWRELGPVVHAELNRLPEKYRQPLILCYLEGKTNEEAAGELRWPVGTVKGRLHRGRELLRRRLVRRGVTLSTAALTSLVTSAVAEASFPASLVSPTVHAAVLMASGSATAATSSAAVASIVEGVIRDMSMTKLKLVSVLALTVGLVGAGASWLRMKITAAEPPAGPQAKAPATNSAPGKARQFDARAPMNVFQLTRTYSPRYLGSTPTLDKRGVTIPGGASWYVSPFTSTVPAPGAGIGGFAGLGGGMAAVGGGGALGMVGGGVGGFGGAGGGAGFVGGPFPPGGGAGLVGFGGGFGGFGGNGGNIIAIGGPMPAGQGPLPILRPEDLAAFVAEAKRLSVPGIAFENVSLTNDDLASLKDLKELQILILRRTQVTDDGLKELANLPKLTTLTLHGEGFTPAGVARLKDLPSLRSLELGGATMTDDVVARLKELPRLKTLKLSFTKITDNGLKQLAALEEFRSADGLEVLEIRGGAITDQGIQALAELKGLRELRLYLVSITDAGLQSLKALENLTALAVDCCTYGAPALVFGNASPQVMQLQLATPDGMIDVPTGKVTDAGLQHISSLRNLTELSLGSDHITDQGLANLTELTNLEFLRLHSRSVGDGGLSALRNLKRLHTVDLLATHATPTGVVPVLRQLPRLGLFYVPAFSTPKQVAQYKKEFPRVRLQTVADISGLSMFLPNGGMPGVGGGAGAGGIGGGGGAKR